MIDTTKNIKWLAVRLTQIAPYFVKVADGTTEQILIGTAGVVGCKIKGMFNDSGEIVYNIPDPLCKMLEDAGMNK